MGVEGKASCPVSHPSRGGNEWPACFFQRKLDYLNLLKPSYSILSLVQLNSLPRFKECWKSDDQIVFAGITNVPVDISSQRKRQ